MSAPINLESYSDALVVLGTAGVVVPLVRRLGLSPVLGYLAAGAILGPLGLGSFIHTVPILYWFTIVDAKNVAGIADLGVVFLLFVIGMELSYERLKAMRYLVFGLGGLQVLLTTIAIGAVLMVAGVDAEPAAILGACLALSSTAIVVEVLAGKGRLSTTSGRASFAVLLAQDLAVVPILVFISIAGADTGGSIGVSILLALAPCGYRHRRHRGHRPPAAAAAVPAGRGHRLARTVHRRDPVRHRQHRARCRGRRHVHGARGPSWPAC